MREEMQKKKDTEISNIEEGTENVQGDNESINDSKQEHSNDVSVDKNGMYYYLYIQILFYSYKMYV